MKLNRYKTSKQSYSEAKRRGVCPKCWKRMKIVQSFSLVRNMATAYTLFCKNHGYFQIAISDLADLSTGLQKWHDTIT